VSCCKINDREVQRIPRSNLRTILVDAALPKHFDQEEGNVFSYKLTSVTQSGDELEQRGCGPNFQGGRITLCTCMRYHRTWPSIEKGTWIAGFTANHAGNKLFYLMRIEHVAETFTELWNSDWVPDRRAKSARYDVFGDVYEPLSRATAKHPHNPDLYYEPVEGHKHNYGLEWHKDIRRFHLGKPHKLLVGEPGKSFIWRRPRYSYKEQPHPRFQLFQTTAEFFKHLQ
jgi:hypothetical protein